jgi:hypothetical protein
MSAILPTKKAEIRGIMTQCQPEEIVSEILSQKNSTYTEKKRCSNGRAPALQI